MKLCHAFLLAMMPLTINADIEDYADLISKTISACRESSMLLSPTFTNELVRYWNSQTNPVHGGAAKLSMSIALLQMFESNSDDQALEIQIALTSNVVSSVSVGDCAWIHYTGAFLQMCGLNAAGRSTEGYVVSTNAYHSIGLLPPDMNATNFWSALLELEDSPQMDMRSAFAINSALELKRLGCFSELSAYTNSLSHDALQVYYDNVNR